MRLTKWILFTFIISALLCNAIHSQPTPIRDIKKRQQTPTDTDVIDYHHVTLTRTTTSKATATSTQQAGQNGGSGSSQSALIPAYTAPWYVAVYGTESGISPTMASLGAILIVIGLFLCGMGFRMFRSMLCVMGLLTFGSMAWIGLANCKPAAGYSMDSITMIVVPVAIGVVGAAAYYFLWSIAIYLVSAFGGFIFAVFILTWRSDLVIVHPIGRPCFLGGMALLMAVVAFFAVRPALFFTTSFVGAYVFMFGVDCLARVGFIAGPQSMFNRNHVVDYSLGKYVYVILTMTILLFLISYAWQMLFNAAHHLGMHLVAAATGKPPHEEMRAAEEGGLPHPPSTPPP